MSEGAWKPRLCAYVKHSPTLVRRPHPQLLPILASERPLPAPQAADAPALDFQLNESAAAAIQTGDAAGAPPVVAAVADLVRGLEIEETEAEPQQDAVADSAKEQLDEVPTIEIQEVDEPEAEGEGPPGEKRDRVISTNQLADIRARMQEKMRAAKSKIG
jgi:hypothetical protein